MLLCKRAMCCIKWTNIDFNATYPCQLIHSDCQSVYMYTIRCPRPPHTHTHTCTCTEPFTVMWWLLSAGYPSLTSSTPRIMLWFHASNPAQHTEAFGDIKSKSTCQGAEKRQSYLLKLCNWDKSEAWAFISWLAGSQWEREREWVGDIKNVYKGECLT